MIKGSKNPAIKKTATSNSGLEKVIGRPSFLIISSHRTWKQPSDKDAPPPFHAYF